MRVLGEPLETLLPHRSRTRDVADLPVAVTERDEGPHVVRALGLALLDAHRLLQVGDAERRAAEDLRPEEIARAPRVVAAPVRLQADRARGMRPRGVRADNPCDR